MVEPRAVGTVLPIYSAIAFFDPIHNRSSGKPCNGAASRCVMARGSTG